MRPNRSGIAKAAIIWLVCIVGYLAGAVLTAIVFHGRIERPILAFLLWPVAIIACLIRGNTAAANETLSATVGAFAILPLWVRLFILWVAAGLGLSAYEGKVAAGDGIAAAIGKTILDGLVKPVTFIAGLFDKKDS